MSEIAFWFVIAVLFVFLWWAGFYATKDMRIGKNKMREEQAKRNLELYAKQQAEEAARLEESNLAADESKRNDNNRARESN